jgi:hypothetical protein
MYIVSRSSRGNEAQILSGDQRLTNYWSLVTSAATMLNELLSWVVLANMKR